MLQEFFNKRIEEYISALEDEIIINMADESLYEGFNLSKNTEDNYHIGEENKFDIVCPDCGCIIFKTGQTVKVKKDVSFVHKRSICLQTVNSQRSGMLKVLNSFIVLLFIQGQPS